MQVTAQLAERTLRHIEARDLDTIVKIDAVASGRTRRFYFERRMTAARAQPDEHVQFGVEQGGRLVGFVFARRLAGEFGSIKSALRMEVIGVTPAARSDGIGRQLIAALEEAARGTGSASIRTLSSWRDHGMLRFLDRAGFALGAIRVLECAVHGGRLGAEPDADLVTRTVGQEHNYAAEDANDFETLARDRADVRVLAPDDVADICRIDRRITARDRGPYIQRLVDEALHDSAVRVSLTARVDGIVAGFVMARTDFGDFGRAEPAAVLDTIGVAPEYMHQGVGTALLSQLLVNLQALRIERVETMVAHRDFALLGFLDAVGFAPSQRLDFYKLLG